MKQLPEDVPGEHVASLQALRDRSWFSSREEDLTGEQVISYYLAIRRQELHRVNRSSRRWDKAVSMLKKHGLVRYVRGTGWRCTDQLPTAL